jgi:glutamine amidotransferase
MPPEVAVVDYGAGNLRSVAKALARSGLAPEVTGDPAALLRADAVVLPGVGAFAEAARNLRAKGLDEAVREFIGSGRPYLGLCLGLQLLFEESDEHGRTPGLGLLPGRVERFPERDAGGRALRVPHIGWNRVAWRGEHPLLRELPEADFYYFVHGYRALPARAADGVGWVDYGGEFAAAVARGNLFAVQFHPEKSQGAGRRLLDAFARWVAACG